MNKQKRGFTLIELLVVVMIIGILAAVALPQYARAVEKARAAEAISIAEALHKGLSLYFLVNQSFPTSFEDLDVTIDPNASKTFDAVMGGRYGTTGFRVRRLGKGFSAWDNDYYEIVYAYDNNGQLVARYCSGHPCKYVVTPKGTFAGMTKF